MAQVKERTKHKTAALKPQSQGERDVPMTKEDMEMAAYFHWLGRGCPSDDALTDWIEVETRWGGESISK